MEKFRIATRVKVRGDNNVPCEKLQFTLQSTDADVIRMFRLLYAKAHENRLLFDPLGLYTNKEVNIEANLSDTDNQ